MCIKGLFSFLLLFFFQTSFGQQIDFEHLEDLKFRNVGPAGMSGRVTAIDVNLRDKDHIIIGSASGGVWESKNGGITWDPIFDDQPTLAIGAVKFNQANPSEIWVGTGEGNPRNSHNSGAGIFKSLDGGKTWQFKGLKETRLIHRILVNPDNPGHIVVGAMGSAWGPSEHRGVYVSRDGGDTWNKTLYVGDEVGLGEMVVDPKNPNKILASMWEFGRTPWGFNSGGEGSGLYLSYDGGTSWKELTEDDGLPKGELGRMGLGFATNKNNIVYALIEAKENGLYKSTDGGESWNLVSTKNVGNRPFYYAEIYVDPNNENRIYNLWSYVSRSEDGGKTFETIMDYGNAVHPDHHAFWIDPDDSNYLIDGNDGGLNISRDGADSWRFVQNLPLGQFYHVSVDKDFPYNIYGGMQDNGSWVGPAFVLKRGGIRNSDWQEVYFGDGFDIMPLKSDNRYGYAMSQGGNLAYWDKVTGRTEFIQPQHPEGENLRYNWNAALALDPFNDCGVYYGSQYVHYSNDCGKSWDIISPDLTTNDSLKQDQSKSGGLTLDVTGAENHTTLLAIAPSPHDKNVIWTGSDDGMLNITRDGGSNWTALQERLPNMPENAWIPQIEVSSHNPGEVFVVVNNYRQNDWSAYLYHTSNYGESWQRLVDDSSVGGFVCSVIQDPVEDDLVFLGTDVGLYFSVDHGSNWIKWEEGLPPVQIRDMKIQNEHDDLILGTFGRSFWVLDNISILREWSRSKMKDLSEDFKVYDTPIYYQTFNRSYDGIRFIAQGDFVGENKSSAAMFSIWRKPEKKETDNDIKGGQLQIERNKKKKGKKIKHEDDVMDEEFSDIENTDKDTLSVNDKTKLVMSLLDQNGDTLRTIKRKLKEGLNRIQWRPNARGVEYPRRNEPKEKSEPGGVPLLPGNYKAIFTYGPYKDSTVLRVKLDPRIDQTIVNTQAKVEAMKDYNDYVEAATHAYNNLRDARKSMKLYKEIIDVQEDSIQKDIKSLHKEIGETIDSLMQLYFLPESQKPQYRDDSHTLSSSLGGGRRFIGTSLGEPSPNGLHAIEKAKRETEKTVASINEFFEKDWAPYAEQIKALPKEVIKYFEPVEIDNK